MYHDPKCTLTADKCKCFEMAINQLCLGALKSTKSRGLILVKTTSGTFRIRVGRTHGGVAGVKALRDAIGDAINQHVNLNAL